ncbi:hypothetical protein BDN72DRAFT_767328, partial [Pluteus cervinus]
MLFEKAVNVMEQQLKFNICELESSYETNLEVKDLEERIKYHVSEELQYSARYWMHHMVKSGEWSSNHDKAVKKFGSSNILLYWIEILSLLGCVRKTMLELTKVMQWMKVSRISEQTVTYLEEISTFLSQFITPVSESVCHIYISALAYVPAESWIAKQFWKDFENRLKIRNTERQSWKETQRYTRVLNHDSWVSSVAFSSDGKYVISGSWDNTVRIWDVETGQQRGTEFKGHTDYVTSVAF